MAGVALCVVVGAVRAEMVNVVQITDMRGQVAFEIMNREEYAAIQKEIREEMAVYQAAAADAKKSGMPTRRTSSRSRQPH